ncbi:hypothetical protein ACQ4LE_006475 [Meloidogyne hapla]
MVYIYNPPSYGYAQFFGPKQQMVSCPKCKQQSLTQLEYVKGRGGWLGCTMFAGFGGMIFLGGIMILNKSFKKDGGFRNENISICLFVFLLGISFCCCAPIPFYCDNCKDVKHYCGMCNTYIGKYVRDGRRPVVILPPELYGFKNDQPTN